MYPACSRICINSLGLVDVLTHPGLLAGSSYCNRIERSFLKHDDLHDGVMTRTSRHEAYNGMPCSFCSFFHTWFLAACVQVELSTFQCSESISLTSDQTIVVPLGVPKSVLIQKYGDVINTQQARWSWRSEPEDLLSFNTRTVSFRTKGVPVNLTLQLRRRE